MLSMLVIQLLGGGRGGIEDQQQLVNLLKTEDDSWPSRKLSYESQYNLLDHTLQTLILLLIIHCELKIL